MSATGTLPKTCDVVIVGGGIWGLSTAWHLAESHPELRIVLIERALQVADETTRQAAGQLGQFRSDPLLIDAVGYSLKLFAEFRERTGFDPGFQRSGSLHLSLNPARGTALRDQAAAVLRHGVDVHVLDPEAAAELSWELNPRLVESALFLPGDGYVDAAAAGRAFGNAAAERGVEIVCGVEVRDLASRPAGGVTIETDEGRIEASYAVVTSGPWTVRLAACAGVALPVQPIRLQQLRTAPLPVNAAAAGRAPAEHPVVRIPDHACYLRPELGGFLYGYFDPEGHCYDLVDGPDRRTAHVEPDPGVAIESTCRLTPLFPILETLPVAQQRQGILSFTPDGKYVLGPMPSLPDVLFATGCGAMGIAGSAAVGRWLARWVVDGHPGANLSGMAPDRFGVRGTDRRWTQQESRRLFSNYYALNSATYASADGASVPTAVPLTA